MTSPQLATQTAYGRMYSRQVGSEPQVPSITTIIGMDHVDLTGWAGYMAAKSLAEDARLPQAINQPGQMRSLIREAAGSAESFRDAAALRGDRVHTYAEHRALQVMGLPHETERALQALNEHGEQGFGAQFDHWWREYRVEPIAAEVTVWNQSLGYAGTIDLVARIGGRTCLIDYKTKGTDRDGYLKRPDDKVMMQLAAACKAEERIIDAQAGLWEQWEYGTDTMLLAVALGEKSHRTFMAPPQHLPDFWSKFCALHRSWNATRRIGEARSTLQEITPPPQHPQGPTA